VIEISVIKESWFGILASRKRELLTKAQGARRPRMIAVFGGSAVEEDSLVWNWSFKAGSELAKRGAIVYNGGYGGVMAASAAGARAAGGSAVGLLCANLPEGEPNNYQNHCWEVSRWDQRLLALVFLADGYLVMPGSSGTLVELSMVVETQLKGFIPIRPVVCFGDYWRSVVKRIDNTDGLVIFTHSAGKAAELLTTV